MVRVGLEHPALIGASPKKEVLTRTKDALVKTARAARTAVRVTGEAFDRVLETANEHNQTKHY